MRPSLIPTSLLLGALPGCQLLLGDPDYYFEPTIMTPDAMALMARFASGSPSCSACLSAGTCGTAFETCSENPGCTAFAECKLTDPSPASDAWCVVGLEPLAEDRELARALSDCWQGCVQECEGGMDFDCMGNYTWPAAPQSTVTLTQELLFAPAPTPVIGARVSACSPLPDCDSIQLGGEPAMTDEQGRYSVEVPVATEPQPLAGFRGYRLVEGAGLEPHRLSRNVPIMIDLVERTRLLSEEASGVLLPLLGAHDPIDAMFFQVFDCRGVGAGGARLELPESPEAMVGYKADGSEISLTMDGTLTSQEGAGVVTGLEPGRYHRVQATTTSGEPLAIGDVYIPGDAIVLYSLYMNPRPN